MDIFQGDGIKMGWSGTLKLTCEKCKKEFEQLRRPAEELVEICWDCYKKDDD